MNYMRFFTSSFSLFFSTVGKVEGDCFARKLTSHSHILCTVVCSFNIISGDCCYMKQDVN